MSNLLVITDVARLRKIFSRLTEDKNIRLRVVNNLEKGGEEIAIEKPDVVFVQTHLSGLSADILLMHLKKQLGRKRSRFVLLAAPGQTKDSILRQYQGWLDTSTEDVQLLIDLHRLLAELLDKPKKAVKAAPAEAPVSVEIKQQPVQPVSKAETSALLDRLAVVEGAAKPDEPDLQLPAVSPATTEPSLEEQGITYAPRQRLKVYSEFNSSFDSAVNNVPEPESVEQTVPLQQYDWNKESIETVDSRKKWSKVGIFLLWLAPVVAVVVVITYFQQGKPDKEKVAPTAITAPVSPAAVTAAVAAKPAAAIPTQPAPAEPDRITDKDVLKAISESRSAKVQEPPLTSASRLTNLPDFIPRYGFDKQYGAANPGWERYKGAVTEFKLLREAKAIKAIQVIDRGGNGVPESFMKAVLRQVTKVPRTTIETSEKKEGYEIKRGHISENIKVVFYRDEAGGKLRAFVLTWQ